MIHEIQYGRDIVKAYSMQEYHGLRVSILFQHGFEHRTAGGEDQFVCPNGLSVRHEGDVQEVFLVPDVTEGIRDIRLEVIPAETILFRAHAEASGGAVKKRGYVNPAPRGLKQGGRVRGTFSSL